MRRIVSLIDSEEAFVNRLCDYINSNEDSYLKAVAGPCDGALEICFCDENYQNSGESNKVFKYQSADKLLRDIMKIYDGASQDKISKINPTKSCIRGVYSPVNRCGKTAFALTMGLVLGGESKCLLLTLDEYAGVFRFIAQDAVSDLSDVIYAYRKREFFWNRLVQSIYQFGVLSYIPPVRYAQDISELGVEELKELIERLAADGGYENIIIDFGSFGKHAMELMDICNEVYMPMVEDKISRAKVDEFYVQMQAAGSEDLAAKIKQVVLPYTDNLSDRLLINEEDYLHGGVYEYTRDLFKDAAGAGE